MTATQSGPRDVESVIATRYTLTEKGWDATGGSPTGPDAPAGSRILAALRAFHDAWGDVPADDIDPLDLWENLGVLLDALEQVIGGDPA